MAEKRVGKEKFRSGRNVLDIEIFENQTYVRDAKGTIVFKIPGDIRGAWSLRRIIRTAYAIYKVGIKEGKKEK